MPTLDENGREILDQTPVSLPLNYDRPEPLHLRIRRMILEATATQNGDDVETIDDANDFLIPDDPSSFDTSYTEPDYDPSLIQQQEKPFSDQQQEKPFSDEAIAAVRAAIDALRAPKTSPSEPPKEEAAPKNE